jgi:hypothetical protein
VPGTRGVTSVVPSQGDRAVVMSFGADAPRPPRTGRYDLAGDGTVSYSGRDP